MFSPPNAEVGRLLSRLTKDVGQHLGDNLIGLYLHGSLVTGDFDPGRSDLDLLALLQTDLHEREVEGLREMHARLAGDFPAWQDRVEVEYVSEAALRDFRTRPHLMARISPGEALHLTEANRHYLLNWSTARRGVALLGPPPDQVLPEVTRTEFVEAVRQHAGSWGEWVTEMRHPGGQAYTVLTLCRALYSTRHGEQVSKRRAAGEVRPLLPGWAPLIDWAAGWWYGGGQQTPDEDHFDEVVGFVGEVRSRILGGHDLRGQPSGPSGGAC
ncbi:aminoglycoside adenylyltransferase domain-containing protein [Deinococcus apachensis]|uniref:aminoglycoside adenylyltransferase domain-containing protein n=1 Tax=Deinococcus apachensis TaxID=309886 RepID=UPI00039E34AB|nr:aminoglycoside adenylyltransferase domain-containing protein [Deinococcus apachensis]